MLFHLIRQILKFNRKDLAPNTSGSSHLSIYLHSCFEERPGEIDMSIKMETTCTWIKRPYEASLFPGIAFGLFCAVCVYKYIYS